MACRTRTLLALIGLPAALLGTATGARADAVVLQSSGPSAASYAQGAVLRDTQVVSLDRGDSLRLLVGEHTVLLQGPYKGPPRASASPAEPEAAWDGMLRAKPRSRGAAVRGYTPPPAAPAQPATPEPPKD